MPIIKSAKKRVKQTRKATARNARTKRSLKEAFKAFTKSSASTDHKKAQSAIDTAVKKNLMHKNKAARKQRQLAAAAKKAGVKPSATVKKAAAKAPVKKAAPKKVAAKKPVVKKAAPKKK